MAVTLAPPMILQFLDPNNSGAPAAGFQLFTYAAGTSTKQATWTDSSQITPWSNPVVLDSNGAATVWGDPTLAYKFVLASPTDSDPPTSPLRTVDNLYFPLTTASIATLQFNYPQSAGEIASGVVPTNYGYPPGDIRRYGAVGDSGITDNTIAIQKALTANAGYAPIYIPSDVGYYKVTSRLTAAANTHIIMEEGAQLLWSATTATGSNLLGSPTRPGIEVLGDNFRIQGKGKLVGPGTAAANSGAGGGGVTAYVGNEFCLLRVGTSAASRGSGFVVEDVNISLWGSGGICLQFVQHIYVNYTVVHDVGYDAMHFLSCQNGRIHNNLVYGVAPGTSSNAYGISCSHDSTNYSSDPNVTAAPRQVVNPFCIDMDVGYNEVRDIPLWTAIDAHGAYEVHMHHNKVYNCHRALQCSSSSGAAVNYAGENNSITDNVIYGNQVNGNATTDASGFQAGVVVNGGSVLTHRGVVVRNNHFFNVGHANVTPSVFVLEASVCDAVIIQGNTFRGCVGHMIHMNTTHGAIKDNVFDSLGASATGSNLLYIDSNCGPLSVTGNIHSPLSGTLTAATNGLNTPGGVATRITVAGNDFAACTNPYTNITGTSVRNNSELMPLINDTTTGSHTIDVSVVGSAPRFTIVASQGSAATLTSLTNPAMGGQECTIQMTGGSTLTVNNSGNIKLQGGTISMTSSSELVLHWDGAKWQELSRSVGNS